MLSKVPVVAGDGWSVFDVYCDGHHQGWSDEEVAPGPGLVLIRTGRFTRRLAGTTDALDTGSAYFELPGAAQRFRHEDEAGDRCTFVDVDADLLSTLVCPGDLPRRPALLDGSVLLRHHLVLAPASRADPGFTGTEAVLRLLAAVLGRHGSARPSARPSHGRLAAQARELLATEPAAPRSLSELARALDVSPSHLSRVFSRETGCSISEFRTTMRLRLALERLAGGESDLAVLARDLGFADHAHLTRTLRRRLGAPPSELRRRLTGPAA